MYGKDWYRGGKIVCFKKPTATTEGKITGQEIDWVPLVKGGPQCGHRMETGLDSRYSVCVKGCGCAQVKLIVATA